MARYLIPLRRDERYIQQGEIEIEADSPEAALRLFAIGAYDEDDVTYGAQSFEESDPWFRDDNYPVQRSGK